LACASAILFGSAPQSAAQGCTTYSGLTYATYLDGAGATQNLQLDLMVPASSGGPVPVVIFIHGGGWRSGSRLPIPSPRVTGLCSRGYAVASVDYRLTTVALWPAQIQDVKGAVRWLRANAATYNLDPDRFGAWGESAGGHLAAMLGVTGDVRQATVGNAGVDLEGSTGGNAGYSSRVQAVVDWYGPTDSLQMHYYPASTNHDSASSDESRLIGAAIQNNPEMVATTNPVTYVSRDDAPILVMHGTVDNLIPFNQSQLLVDALRAQFVSTTFRPAPDLGHGGSVWNNVAIYQPVYDFLDQVLLGAVSQKVRVDATAPSAAEPGTDGAFTITRTGGTSGSLLVRWVLSGTATAGADFTLGTSSVILPAGVASATVPVPALDDSLVEGDETITMSLVSDPAFRIESTGASATITLADDESPSGLPVATVSASDSLAAETGANDGAFLITRSGDTSASLIVKYSVSGTATNGSDFATLSGSITIPAGQASSTLALTPVDDTAYEVSETAIVSLSASAAYTLGANSVASVAILDTDGSTAKPTVAISAADPDAAEPIDAGTFFVWRTGSTANPFTVNLDLGGTAANGADYTAVSTSVTFPAGSNRVAVDIDPIDDLDTESLETVTLGVPVDPAILIGSYVGTVSLVDDDPPGAPELVSFSLSPGSVVGTQTATGTVTLSGPAPSVGATLVLTSSDPASAAVPASLTVPQGASSGTFTITTNAVSAAQNVTITAARRGVTHTAALAVQPPSVQSLMLSTGSIPGGCRTSTGRVILNAKAPSGGAVVPITNTNPVAIMPSSVTVPAGATAVNFTISGPTVTTTSTGTVTASYGGTSASGNLTVRPIGVASLSLTPNPVVGPADVAGTVTLECAAAPGDVAVSLTTTASSIAYPSISTLVIPAGSTTGTFTVHTADVSAPYTVNIRATAANVGHSVYLKVN
jgi:acetyl esterase/lipase